MLSTGRVIPRVPTPVFAVHDPPTRPADVVDMGSEPRTDSPRAVADAERALAELDGAVSNVLAASEAARVTRALNRDRARVTRQTAGSIHPQVPAASPGTPPRPLPHPRAWEPGNPR